VGRLAHASDKTQGDQQGHRKCLHANLLHKDDWMAVMGFLIISKPLERAGLGRVRGFSYSSA
ncbi:MAG: hypothetical protein WBM15_13090, partial [Chromatiaceae bacterium]